MITNKNFLCLTLNALAPEILSVRGGDEKRNFIRESFQLDSNKILNQGPKLKEEVIKLFLNNFDVLAIHPS